MLPKLAYTHLGLPVHYHGITYKDTKIPQTKIEPLVTKVNKAPSNGVLLISGTAAPVVNQLSETRKIVGLNFVDFYNSKLSSEETMDLPKASVVCVYSIGSEPANNPQFASKILGSIIAHYKSCLLVLETDKTISNFQTTYGLSIANTISIPQKEAEQWI